MLIWFNFIQKLKLKRFRTSWKVAQKYALRMITLYKW